MWVDQLLRFKKILKIRHKSQCIQVELWKNWNGSLRLVEDNKIIHLEVI